MLTRRHSRRADKLTCCGSRREPVEPRLPAGVVEDLEDLFDQGFAFVGGEVAGMDGLFIGLEVTQARLFGQIPVNKADDGVNLLTGQSVAAAGQSAPHVDRPFREVGRCRGRLYRWATLAVSSLPGRRASREGAVFCGYEALSLTPGVGRYMEFVVVYLDDVEARCAPWTDAIRDRPRGRDDQTAGAPIDGVDGVLVIVPAEDQLRTEVGEGVEGLLRVGDAVASGEFAPYGIVVHHHDAAGVGSGVLEDPLHTCDVSVFDLSYHTEVTKAAGDGTPRDTVGRVYTRNDRPRHLQRRTQVLRDVPDVPGVLELVGLLPEETGEAEVAGHGPEPADVVVAGDDGVRCYLPEGIQVGAGVRKLPVRAALRQVAGDGHSVWLYLCNILSESVEAFGDRGTPEVQV